MEASLQRRVGLWIVNTFGEAVALDPIERNYRFLEEALELVQSRGMTKAEAHALVDYVFDRDQGDVNQEVGGVMITLAALCHVAKIHMDAEGDREFARINRPEVIEKIRRKQATKKRYSPLPGVEDASR